MSTTMLATAGPIRTPRCKHHPDRQDLTADASDRQQPVHRFAQPGHPGEVAETGRRPAPRSTCQARALIAIGRT